MYYWKTTKEEPVQVQVKVPQTDLSIPEICYKAARLMFPYLPSSDWRIEEVAKYAANELFERFECPICVLCAIPHSTIEHYRNLNSFCQELGLFPERREVVISGNRLRFTEDYGIPPEAVA